MVHLGDYPILLESQLGQEGQSIIPIQQIRPPVLLIQSSYPSKSQDSLQLESLLLKSRSSSN